MFSLVHRDTLPHGHGSIPTDEVVHTVTNALRESGFLITKAPQLTPGLQRRALSAATVIPETESSTTVVSHPTDPNIYACCMESTLT